MRYEHGTLAGYKHDGCRCDDCRGASNQYEVRRRRLKAYGRWGGVVPATEAREQLQAWRAQRITWKELERATGVADSILTRITCGSQQRITAATSTAILGAHPIRTDVSRIPSIGTARRVQALQCLGWRLSDIGKEAGVHGDSLRAVVKNQYVYVSTARGVERAVRVLIHRTPPTGERHTTIRNQARKAGWAPLGAWDDIDDPDEVPNLGASDRVRGQRPFSDLHEDVTHLANSGATPEQIAKRVGVSSWDYIRHAYRLHNTPLPLPVRTAA